MPDDPSAPQPTPTNYQRTTGGSHLRWQPPTPEHLQEMLPAYEILSILGQGGMGAVYKGRQKSLDRIVAIKILPPEAGEDDMQFVERFKNEARTMAKMNHPAIVHVYDFGETTEGQLYIVMEYIDGTDVAKMIQEKKKLPEDYALSITAHVCDALGYAHTHGVVHRDIKPANVLINMEGQVKVADFGLAKATDPSQMGLTKTNMAMGTPDFVSPEALMPGVPLDGRADLYAMGVMLFNMLTGTIPRGAFRMPSLTHQTDARFDKIIGKAMEMDRELRYQTALDLRRDLDVILTTPAAKTGMQTIPAQEALPARNAAHSAAGGPQKPMGKSPGPPQQKPAANAGMPAGSSKPPQGTAKPATTSAPAPAPKSNAGMIYGIAAAIAVVAVAVFMFAGGGKKPSAESKSVAESKPETPKPDPKPASPTKPTPKPAPSTATISSASSEVITFGGHRYQLLHEQMTWEAAKTKAEALGGHLVTITTTAEADFVREKFLSQVLGLTQNVGARRLMLGGQWVNANSAWKWVTGEPFDLSLWVGKLTVPKGIEPRYLSWDYGLKRWEHSSALVEYFPLIEWEDDGSAKPAPVATTAKPGDVLTFGGHRYQYVQGSISWTDAKAKAQAMDGHLVTLTSKAEDDAVREAFKSNLKGGADPLDSLWIGASRPTADAPWTWVTGEPFAFTNWATGEPNLLSGAPPWVLTYRDKDARWRDDGLTIQGKPHLKKGFIVEWDDNGSSKPADILSFSGHRYQLVMEKLSWNAAKTQAEAMGGHLAVIDSKEKLDWVWDKFSSKLKKIPGDQGSGRLSIGGHKPLGQDAWEWVTGKPLTIQPWMGNFPNDKEDTAKVITIFERHFDDVKPKIFPAAPFLVEWDDDGSTKSPAASPALTAPVNLLALVDVKRDAVLGQWELKPEGLILQKGEKAQVLGFPFTPPAEYDFEIEFTLTAGREVGQILPLPSGAISWKMGTSTDGRYYGFGPTIDGKGIRDKTRTAAVTQRPELKLNQRYRSVVEVRQGSLRALMDGEEVVKWSGDLSRLKGDRASELPDPKHLGINGFDSGMICHKAEVRPLAPGTTAPTPPPVAASPAPVMPTVAPAPAPPADPRLAQLEAGYQARYDADAQKPFLAAVATLNQSYVANGIGKVRAAAQAKGSLSEITALDAEKAAIEKGSGVPMEDAEGTPESLKALRGTYRGALSKITAERAAKAAPLLDLYLKAIDVYIAELTQAGKIDEAKQVQALRDTKAAMHPTSGAGVKKLP